MRLSKYFLPVLKETPAEAQIASHRLMLRAGMIRQASAGIYSWLPLGYRVLRRIEAIVHEEQQRAGHIPLLMPTVQSAELWQESGRYDDYGAEMLRIRDRHDRDLLYGPTNEELITDIFRPAVTSYHELPLTLYHIQWKFRDEIRPRFGVMRGREFLMKDGYNFDLTAEDALHAYNRHMVSYIRTYERMGLKAIPMRAVAGAIGGDYTHEFLVLAPTGESAVFYDRAVTDLTLGDRAVDYADRRRRRRSSRPGPRPTPAPTRRHDDALFAEVPRRGAGRGPRHRGRADLLLRHQVFRADEGAGGQRGRRAGAGAHGLARHRRLRGWSARSSRRATTSAASSGREGVTPFHVGHRQPQAGRRRRRRRLRGALRRADARRARAALRRPRRTGGGEVRHHGPDRPALAHHRRPARPGGGHGRADLAGAPARARRCRRTRRWRAARKSIEDWG